MHTSRDDGEAVNVLMKDNDSTPGGHDMISEIGCLLPHRLAVQRECNLACFVRDRALD